MQWILFYAVLVLREPHIKEVGKRWI